MRRQSATKRKRLWREQNRERDRATSRRWRTKHLEQARAISRRWFVQNPEKLRANHLRVYGLTPQDYVKMLALQGGVCAICGEVEQAIKNGCICSLSVDHDHDTGKVRGLLCQRCNSVLGFAGDDIDLLYRTVKYLDKLS